MKIKLPKVKVEKLIHTDGTEIVLYTWRASCCNQEVTVNNRYPWPKKCPNCGAYQRSEVNCG